MYSVETWLPVFPGFYETGFFDEDRYTDEVQYYKDEIFENNPEFNRDLLNEVADNIDGWDGLIKWDNRGFEKDSAIAACKWVEDALNEIFKGKCVFKIIFQQVWSPREYNFRNDHIDCEIKYSKVKPIVQYLKDHIEAFKKYLEDQYTSCDGFISHYSNQADKDGWLVHSEWDAHQFGAVLDFIIRNYYKETWSEDQPEFDSMLYYVEEQICYGDYIDATGYEKLFDSKTAARESKKLNAEEKSVSEYLDIITDFKTRLKVLEEKKKGYIKWVKEAAEQIYKKVAEEAGLDV